MKYLPFILIFFLHACATSHKHKTIIGIKKDSTTVIKTDSVSVKKQVDTHVIIEDKKADKETVIEFDSTNTEGSISVDTAGRITISKPPRKIIIRESLSQKKSDSAASIKTDSTINKKDEIVVVKTNIIAKEKEIKKKNYTGFIVVSTILALIFFLIYRYWNKIKLFLHLK